MQQRPAQKTHCSCTRHVPRRVPRPCPCTTGVMKSRTDHLSAAEATAQKHSHACNRGGDTGDTLQLHKARTKARASSMPVHNRCNEIKNRSFIAAEAATQQTHCSCTRHVPRRVPRPCPCTTGVMKSTTDHLSAVTHAAEAATLHTAVALGTYQGACLVHAHAQQV